MCICSSLSIAKSHINGLDGFVQIYYPSQGDIVSAECISDKTGTNIILLTQSNTKLRDLHPKRIDAGHVGECGLVFYDGKYYYTSWGGAVFCLSMEDDSQIWRYDARGHGGHIMLSEDETIIVLCDDGIYKLNPPNGELIARQANSEYSHILTNKYVLYGPVRNKFHILDVSTMERVQSIKATEIHPNINRARIVFAFLYGSYLTVHGFYSEEHEKYEIVQPQRFSTVLRVDVHD